MFITRYYTCPNKIVIMETITFIALIAYPFLFLRASQNAV